MRPYPFLSAYAESSGSSFSAMPLSGHLYTGIQCASRRCLRGPSRTHGERCGTISGDRLARVECRRAAPCCYGIAASHRFLRSSVLPAPRSKVALLPRAFAFVLVVSPRARQAKYRKQAAVRRLHLLAPSIPLESVAIDCHCRRLAHRTGQAHHLAAPCLDAILDYANGLRLPNPIHRTRR